jgi:hypothetical protein
MGTYIIMIAVLGVFAMRDAQLLAIGPAKHAARRLALYASCLFACFLTLELTAPAWLDPHGVMAILRLPPVWLACIGIHLGSWIACAWAKRSPSVRQAWTLALIPSPLVIVGVLLLSTTLTPLASQRHIQIPIFALFWSAGVAIMANWIGPAIRHVQDQNWRLDFGGWANVLAIVLIPLDALPGGLARCRQMFEAYLRWD